MSAATTATATKINYEMTACARCGGSGHYSFNQMHGTVCYGCGGRGKVMTARAKKAHAAIAEFIDKNFTVAAKDVKVGDVVMLEDVVFMRTGKMKPRTVTAVGKSGCSIHTAPDGTEVRTPYISLQYVRNDEARTVCNNSVFPTTLIRLPLTGDRWTAVVEFARKLKGVTITEGGR